MTERLLHRVAVVLGLVKPPPPWRTLGRDRGLVRGRAHERPSYGDAAFGGAVHGPTLPALTRSESR